MSAGGVTQAEADFEQLSARAKQHFSVEPSGDGWVSWNLHDHTRFNSFIEPLFVRLDASTADGRPVARIRMEPRTEHTNLSNNVHGAIILALIDVSLFAAAHHFGSLNAGASVTLDLSTQFVGGGQTGMPLDCVVEQVRETGRLVFLRGLVVQGEGDSHFVASFTGTIRKPSPPKAA